MDSPNKVLNNLNIQAKKTLGQNFLINSGTAECIVNFAKITNNDIILEIGPGLGSLTFYLASVAKKVYAVEKDSTLIRFLENQIDDKNYTNIKLIEKDILDLDLDEIFEIEKEKIIVVGNLPYNISSQIIIKLIESRKYINRAILMFQKELSQRIRISCGNRESSRISVMLHYYSYVKKLSIFKASLFFPKPKVDSELVEIIFKEKPEIIAKDEKFLFLVVKAAFSKRRKNLKNALCESELKLDSNTALMVLDKSKIDHNRRAETLSIAEFINLSDTLNEHLIMKKIKFQ
ncbi:MAG: ribosomal RNA small subunit methyltransferase A [Desulfobacterales bacterium]|nr:ribosomal RNA small subunit methyltransferase A [Desulfobacterales bacterium]MBF0396540.1 ribosomal RNA small subunit methyltransferase A [Desulfobacterales bacterium]